MPHQVLKGKYPELVILHYFGNIEADDIITDPEELHLADGKPKYLLADTGDVNPVVPEGMWERVHHSIISHENLAHIAIHVKSNVLRVLMGAILKLTRQRNRVTLHQTYEEAEAHLIKLIETVKQPSS